MVLKLFIKKYGVYKVIKQQQKQQQRKKKYRRNRNDIF